MNFFCDTENFFRDTNFYRDTKNFYRDTGTFIAIQELLSRYKNFDRDT